MATDNKFINKAALTELIALIKKADAADQVTIEKLLGTIDASGNAVALQIGTQTYGTLKAYVDALSTATVNGLAATVFDGQSAADSTAVEDGSHVAVKVVETDGKLASLTVMESDIASAATVGTASTGTKGTEGYVAGTGLTGRIEALEALTGTSDVATQISTAITALDAEKASTDLGTAVAATFAAGATTADATEAETKVKVAVSEVDGKLDSVTVTTTDIASAAKLAQEVQERQNAIAALDADVKSADNADAAAGKGTNVNVEVVEADGKITAVKVTESDIASAEDLEALQGVVGYSAIDSSATDGTQSTVKARLEALEATHAKTDAGAFKSVSTEVNEAVTALVDGAPDALNTLNEIADWIANQGTVEGKDGQVTDATSLVARVDANTKAIGTQASGSGDSAVAATGLYKYVDDSIAAAKSTAAAAVAALDATVNSTDLGTATAYVAATTGTAETPAAGASTKVKAQVVETDGKLTSVTITTTDIASAALLDQEIAKRQEAIAALDADVTSDDDAPVTVQVQQVNGKITDVVVAAQAFTAGEIDTLWNGSTGDDTYSDVSGCGSEGGGE